uniref:Protein kinase domain-containing protein n=1 Tax=Kalanchoe fedtschenkoi TaxID=63787 RepID=A0A7N0T4B0_KALFE
MPSRLLASSAARGGGIHFVTAPLLAGGMALALLSFLLYVIRKLICRRTATVPSDAKLPALRRFSHSALCRATSSFAVENRLGKGGFGSVYGGVLAEGRSVAVKVMDSGSLQGEREFENEVLLAGMVSESERVLPILGFAARRRKKHGFRELALVYELMENGSLQDALMGKRRLELMAWKVRFQIAVDVADAIFHLHCVCDPAVVHGDVKASNVLLDGGFRAKLADFGLASVKCGKRYCQAVDLAEEEGVRSVAAELADEKMEEAAGIGDSKQEFAVGGLEDGVGAGCDGLNRCLSPDSLGMDVDLELKEFEEKGNGVGAEFVNDILMEWNGCEEVTGLSSPGRGEEVTGEGSVDRMEKAKKLPREWWKEEFCAELTEKSEKRRRLRVSTDGLNVEEFWPQSDSERVSTARRIKRNLTNIDRCYHQLNFDILKQRRSRTSVDWVYADTPKSQFVTSTPSMKGTVCYTAPELSCAGQLSEKCDVYSFGVLLLVLISGRRPLEMTSSLVLDFERANLVSWARQLALEDKLLDLIDPDIKSLDKEQATRCLTVAILCLQRSPANRPTMKDIVQMLNLSSDPPHLPLEFSPSPPINFTFKPP